MARSRSLILDGASGALGKQIVIKHYSYGTVLSGFPDMSRIKPSRSQKQKRSTFKEAVSYAQGILRDPAKKAAYKKGLKKGESVYHKAIQEYMRKAKG